MVVEDGFAAVFAGNPDLESILPPKASEISRWRPDLSLNLHGGMTSVRLTTRGAVALARRLCPFPLPAVYNIQIPRAQEILHVDRKVHTAEHVASAMFYLGVPLSDIPRARLFAESPPSQRPYAVLHPMASTPDKTWPSSNFVAVAEHLDKRLSLEPVFIAGPGESLDAFSSYRCLAGAPLEEIKSLLAGASLFIGNDSGPAHMAAAFGLPVVVLFGSSDPEIWSPWRTESSVLDQSGRHPFHRGLGSGPSDRDRVRPTTHPPHPTTQMSEFRRLLRFVRPYTAPLLASVVLMAAVGAAQGFMAVLIGPVFDRVLKPDSPDSLVPLITVPGFTRPIYLQDILPSGIHNVWTMVAVAILATFLIKGLCDYFGNYLVNYVGFSAVTDLRQKVFDRVLRQDANFFESNSTGRLMSSIMNDLEKIQVATSHMLADWLRQSFSVIFLLWVVVQKDWRLALVSLTVLPFVLVPTLRIGRRIRRTTRRAQDDAAELNQILQETLSGHQVVKSFGTEDIESNRFQIAAHRLKSSNLRYVAQQALSSPLIEFFAAHHHRRAFDLCAHRDQERRFDGRRIHQLRDRAADAV